MERLEQQVAFILEVDKIKQIYRQTYLADASRKENDAEHSWHLALMAFLLAEHANESVDVLRVMQMVIIHDLVGIDAGDTYAFDVAGNESKREREAAAAQRIFNLLPPDQAEFLMELWEEFECEETPEAHFAHTLDCAQPMLLNDATGGRSWNEHQVVKSQILKRNENTHLGSETIWAFQEMIIEKNVKRGMIRPDGL